jgi:hypothetical protein
MKRIISVLLLILVIYIKIREINEQNLQAKVRLKYYDALKSISEITPSLLIFILPSTVPLIVNCILSLYP